MTTETILVPDLGGAENVDVIEVCVAVGDTIEAEQSLLVLESDKASMEVPAPKGGKVVALHVNEGDSLSEGSKILELELAGESDGDSDAESSVAAVQPEAPAVESVAEPAVQSEPVAAAAVSEQEVPVPDVGGSDAVEVIEVCVQVGDELAEGDSLVVLESDKASMEIPAPAAGKVVAVKLSEGDKVHTGDVIAIMAVETSAASAAAASEPASESPAPAPAPAPSHAPAVDAVSDTQIPDSDMPGIDVAGHAGPAARKLARQLGVDLTKVVSSGPRSRVTREDIRNYVQKVVQQVESGKTPVASGSGIPPIPEVDFAKFGEVEMVKLSKIAKVTVQNMSRSWLNVPHVTQFDDADITELEDFRKSMKAEAEQRGVKLTPLPFLMKAAAAALVKEPSFNVSLHADGEHKVQKKYVHIGMAVDTPNGLMVPVIRNVDQKSLWQLAEETAVMAAKARAGKLMPNDMQGGCFTISSLGAIGGNGFTPIVNAPEVAIMGVSKAQIKPVWNGSEFVPRQMLPLTVSYDHRAINGADCGRFFTYLVAMLSDIRKLLL
ncbi:MAG: dihydrolipoyllysine-residue acetyltransferase [Candidatus Pelagadaptatus aseana]